MPVCLQGSKAGELREGPFPPLDTTIAIMKYSCLGNLQKTLAHSQGKE